MSLRCIISRVLGGSSKSARLSHELSLAQTLAVKLWDENEDLRESFHRALKREVWAHNTIASLKKERDDLKARLQRALEREHERNPTTVRERLRQKAEEVAGGPLPTTLEELELKGCGR